ncbi:MAG: FAD-binding oxidoreductase [Burkholderiaceae bacterium]|nr:FAD-binding oxidoreductase [Burkholderiaceae bacterium]
MSRSAAFADAAQIAGDCYYEHTVERLPARPRLTDRVDAEVAVIGGGFAGMSAAIELAKRGRKVVLLEAERVAGAASGRNGGQVLPGFGCDIDLLTAELGPEDARRAWDWSVEGMAIVRERALQQGADCEFTPGWLYLAARASHVDDLRAWHQSLGQDWGYGQHVGWVEGPATQTWSASPHYHAAIIDRYAGHLNPLKLALVMQRECEALGVRIHEHSPVCRVDMGAQAVLHTPEGRVQADQVVVAANVFIDGLNFSGAAQRPNLTRRVMPVGNTMIATAPMAPELSARLLRNRFAACDSNFLLDYYRITPDHRMIFGGGSTYLKHDGADRIDALRRKLVHLYPELGNLPVEYAWGGLIDVTMSRAPDFGRLDDRVFYLQGFSGHGVNTTAIAGRVVAEAVAGQPERFDVFSRIRHRDFPPGRFLRRVALWSGTVYYRVRDVLSS